MRYQIDSELVEVKFQHNYVNNKPVSTTCTLITNNNMFQETVKCHPNDNFVRKVGCLLSFKKVFNRLREANIFDKMQRANLFYQVFPRYSTVNKKTNKNIMKTQFLTNLRQIFRKLMSVKDS